jgi:xylan 1,4-beta-xylosidase
LAKLGATELKNQDASSYVCKDSRGGIQVLLWDLTHPTAGKISNQDYFFKPHPAKEMGSVAVKLTNLPKGKYRLVTYRIGYQHNDPYSRYLELGQPADLSREVIGDLNKLSSGAPVSEKTITVRGVFSMDLPMRENDVYLLSLSPVNNEKNSAPAILEGSEKTSTYST